MHVSIPSRPCVALALIGCLCLGVILQTRSFDIRANSSSHALRHLSSRPASSSSICAVPYPAGPLYDTSPLIEHWRLCPLAHQFPWLNRPNPPANPEPPPNLDDPDWATKAEWATVSYPRIFIVDPDSSKMYAIVIQEMAYDVKPDFWTALMTVHQVTTDGDYIAGEYAMGGHPIPNSAFFRSVARFMTCSDSIARMQQPVEIEMSYFFIRLHCPFALRPQKPQYLLQQQRENVQNDDTACWSQNSANFDGSNMVNLPHDYAVRAQLRFHHPLFAAAHHAANGAWNMSSVIHRMAKLKSSMIPSAQQDWLLLEQLLGPSFPASTPLRIPLCMGCIARVDVTACTAPMQNTLYINDVHSHIQYHAALGVQRFTIYDRTGQFSKVLQSYIDSGLVDYQPSPMQWRNLIDAATLRRHYHSIAADQTMALEACRLRAVGISAWIIYKDLDEWITFPPETSFVRQDRTARCYSAEWRNSPSAMFNMTGANRYVHINVGMQEAERGIEHRGDDAKAWPTQVTIPTAVRLNSKLQRHSAADDWSLLNSRTSLYSYYQPKSAAAFLREHRRSIDGLWSDVTCPSPMLAWLTAINDVKLMQRRTTIPDCGDPVAHHDPVHNLLPLMPPATASSLDPANPNRSSVCLSSHLQSLSRWQYYRIVDIEVNGVESVTNESNEGSGAAANHSLLIQRFKSHESVPPVRNARQAKWIGRPELDGLFIHNQMDARAVSQIAPVFDWKPFIQLQPNEARPSEELHFKHFKNFPHHRVEPSPNATIVTFNDFTEIWQRLVHNAEKSGFDN